MRTKIHQEIREGRIFEKGVNVKGGVGRGSPDSNEV
jgi:hypothetical protein